MKSANGNCERNKKRKRVGEQMKKSAFEAKRLKLNGSISLCSFGWKLKRSQLQKFIVGKMLMFVAHPAPQRHRSRETWPTAVQLRAQGAAARRQHAMLGHKGQYSQYTSLQRGKCRLRQRSLTQGLGHRRRHRHLDQSGRNMRLFLVQCRWDRCSGCTRNHL